MDRRTFLATIAALPAAHAMNLNELKNITDDFSSSPKMPVFFVGHGNPMHAVWNNPFTESLAQMGKSIVERPNAILVVSAHWLTRGSYVAVTPKPETIYDFGGFPDELYRVKYPAAGSPEYAHELRKLVPEIKEDHEWGLDHGSWTILKHIFPLADIPVFQLSIDFYQPMQYHFELAQKLRALREKGVLIIGSGNIVHNLRAWMMKRDAQPYDWAIDFDEWVKGRIAEKDFEALVNYEKQGNTARMSVPTTDHYIPLLYTLGLSDGKEDVRQIFEEVESAISMRTFRVG